MSLGRTRQHPPTMRAPSATHWGASAAENRDAPTHSPASSSVARPPSEISTVSWGAANTTSQTLRPCTGAASRSDNGDDTPGTQWRGPGGHKGDQTICSSDTYEYHRRDSPLSVAPRRNIRVASGPTTQ